MAVPSTPPISISDIVSEFGGTAPHSLTEYYRGGSLVPNTTANSGVPTSGSISVLDFLGAALLADHVTTVTIGTTFVSTGTYHDGFFTYTIGTGGFGYGYDGGFDPYTTGTFGAMANSTFSDGGGNNRTISACYYIDTGVLWLTIIGSSVPDTDTTFVGLSINGNYYARSSRTNYYSSGFPSGATSWRWNAGSNPFGTSGTINFTVDVT